MSREEGVTNFTLVGDFHNKFGLEYDGPPRDLDDDIIAFRIRFLIEELAEYADACGFEKLSDSLEDVIADFNDPNYGTGIRTSKRDPEKMLDSLVDLSYVTDGTAYLHGFDFDEAYSRVHQANMQKVRVDSETLEGSVRKSKFDVVKPDGWQPADLEDLVWNNPKEFPAVI